MYMRLGFAVAIPWTPRCSSSTRCSRWETKPSPASAWTRSRSFRRRGKTILFVTHSLGLVEKMCDDVLWLRHGKAAQRGDPKRVVDAYLTYVAAARTRSSPPARPLPSPRPRRGRPRRRPRRAALRHGLTAPALGGPRGRDPRRAPPRRSRPGAPRVHGPGRPWPSPSPSTPRTRRRLRLRGGPLAADGTSVYGTNTTSKASRPGAEGRRRCGSPSRAELVEGTYLVDVPPTGATAPPYDYLRGLHTFR